MKATALPALALLLVPSGALRADPPGVVERLRAGGGTVVGDRDDPGRRAYGVILAVGAADADLAALCELRGLRALSLEDTRVTDAGVARVAGLPGLADLSLEGTAVTDAGLKALGGMRGLESLDLTATRVTDAGLGELAGLPGLRVPDLSGCPDVTAEGVARLREALPRCEVIR
jgi:hypothetical protein